VSKATDKTEVKTVKVKLLKDHEHAGMQYGAGAEIQVSETDEAWLINMGVVANMETTTATKPLEEGK